jgi:hypothetical protein
MDNIGSDSLSWALAHVLRFGDTDVFPVPFEYQAIKAFRREILPRLASIDLEKYRTKSFTRQLIPKAKYGFRTVTQLDPIDTIVLNAIAYESAHHVESYRAPIAQRIACSYRLAPQPSGILFAHGFGWKDFHEASKAHSEKTSTTYVVVADIADFYNQVYHHRLENALESSGVPPLRAKNTEKILLTLTANTSRGIPIGPSCSAVFAEATLADVDSFLQRKTLLHSRYVDDFRIFTSSHRLAIQALHDLTEYLHTTHRLSLQGSKTKILTVQDFINEELYDPTEAEEAAQQKMIIDSILDVTGYSYPFDELETIEIPDDIDINTVTSVLLKLYEEATIEELRPGLARHVLRRAMAIRSRVLIPHILLTLERSLPILPDVINYIIRVTTEKNAQTIGHALHEFISESDYRDLPLVRSWCLHAFASRPELCDIDNAFKVVEETKDQTVSCRYGALIAKAYRSIDWVRERKETWSNTPPSVQRAIVWASTILPLDERKSWLHGPENSGDLLLEFVAKHARSLP